MADVTKKPVVSAGLPEIPDEIKLAPIYKRINWKRIFFILLGLGLFFWFYFMPSLPDAVDPTGKHFPISQQGKAALGLFLMAGIWWVFEVAPIGVTSIAIGLFQALFWIRPAKEAFRDFMDPSVMFIFGSLLIGFAFTKSGLTRRLAYKTIGLVKMSKVGSPKIAALRAKLRGTALIRMAKKSVIGRALEKVNGKPGIATMMDRFTVKIGPSALVFTNLPGIKIRKLFDDNKTKTRAKIGEVMGNDVVVLAGNTKLPPGPAITELQAVGLATKMQDGTIWITKDCVVVKAGQAVDSKIAGVLTKLNVEPVEVLIDLYVAYEGGEVLDRDMLKIDVDKFKSMFIAAQSNALKLSIEAGIVSPENAKIVIQRAFSKAKALAMKLPIIIPELMKDYLAKAQAEALALNAKVTKLSRLYLKVATPGTLLTDVEPSPEEIAESQT